MTAGAHFQINQATNPIPTGTTDTARVDLRVAQIHLVGDSVGNIGPVWTMAAWPPGSARPALVNPTTFDSVLNPDVPGSYRVQYVVNDGIGANVKSFIFAVTSDANGIIYDDGIREPAYTEQAGDDNSTANDRGYAAAFERGMQAQLPVIANQTLLINRRASKHKAVYLLGLATANDGGQGLFYWDGASVAAHVSGQIVQPGFGTGGALATGRWVRGSEAVTSLVVPTFAAARLATSGKQLSLIVQNRAAVGDGGGGTFHYDAADVTSADDDATILVAGTRRYKRQWSVAVHGHWFGMKPGDAAFNNHDAFAAAKAFASGRCQLMVDGAVYHFAQTALVPGNLGYVNSIDVTVSNLDVVGIPGQTVFKFHPFGMGDPNNPAGSNIPIVSLAPSSNPILRTHAYIVGDLRYFAATDGNPYGYSYTCTTAGTTAGSAPASLGTIFSGAIVDGTAQWTFTSTRFRGLGMVFWEAVTDCRFYGITFDGQCPWQDGQTVPPYFPAGTHDFKDSTTTAFMTSDYNGVIYAFGGDIYHKSIVIGGYNGAFAHNIDRIVFEKCQFKNWRGEGPWGDGNSSTSPHSTLTLRDCHFEECPGPSTPVGLTMIDCTFRHCLGALNRAQSAGDLFWTGGSVEDCQFGLDSEQGLVSADPPGSAYMSKIRFRNVYSAGVFLITGTGGTLPTLRGWRLEDLDFHDVGWNYGGFNANAACIYVANGRSDDTFKGIEISRCKMFCEGVVAPARTGGSSVSLGRGLYFAGKMQDVKVRDVQMIRTDTAVTAGKNFANSVSPNFAAGSSDVHLWRCTFTSGNGRASTGAPFLGRWEQIQDTITSFDAQVGLFYSPGATVIPYREKWIVAGADNVVRTMAGLGGTDLWEVGQQVELLRGGSALQFLLFPDSSATHRFPAVRLATSFAKWVVELRLDTSDGVTKRWYEVSYIDPLTGREPEADYIAPTFQTVNSEAPQIQMWGVHTTHLTPSVATDFNNVINAPDESIIQVYFNANTRFRHNTGAGAVKLILLGATDFLPAASGETAFFVDPDAGLAVELVGRRIVGGVVVTGLVPPSRTLTGATPITVAGDHAAHDLSADRTIGLDPAANITTSGDIQGHNLAATNNITAVSDISANRIVSTTGLTDSTVSPGLSLGTSALSWGASGTPTPKGVHGQDGFGTNIDGAGAYVEGGSPTGTGLGGGAWLGFGDLLVHAKRMVEVFQASATRRWASLVKSGAAVAADLPTGDKVVFIADAATLTSTGAANKPDGLAVMSDAGTMRAHGRLDVPTDLTPRGASATGQGRAACEKSFVGQLRTVGNVTTTVMSIDLNGADFGDGIYTFEIMAQLNNITDTTAAMIDCSGAFAKRGTVTGVIFPYATSTGVGLINENAAQGAGGGGALLSSSISTNLVNLDAVTGAGNVGKTIDWAVWVKVKRMALT